MAIASRSKAARSRWRAGDADGEFIVAAAQILRERMARGQDLRGPMTF
jgi:hypothetical protein